MRLILENVGKVQEADIKLDGITLIAGENNTGCYSAFLNLFIK